MAIAVWTESHMACPHCGNAIRRGKRRFGPGRVVCRRCGNELETGLIDLYSLSRAKRIVFIALDWFFPSYYRGMSQPAKFLVMLFHLFIAFYPLISLSIAYSVLSEGGDPITLVVALAYNLFPFLHLLWLRRMVKETKAFHETGKVPSWRSPVRAG